MNRLFNLHCIASVLFVFVCLFTTHKVNAQACTISAPSSTFSANIQLDPSTGQYVVDLARLYQLGLSFTSSCCTGNCGNTQAYFYTSSTGTTLKNPGNANQFTLSCDDAVNNPTVIVYMAVRNLSNPVLATESSTRLEIELNVADATPPQVVAPNDMSMLSAPLALPVGSAAGTSCESAAISGITLTSATAATVNPGQYKDNCAGNTVTYKIIEPDGSMFGPLTTLPIASRTYKVGVTTIQFTVTQSSNGLSATDEMLITVKDITTPVITCPASVTVSTQALTCDYISALDYKPTPAPLVDNCPGPVITTHNVPFTGTVLTNTSLNGFKFNAGVNAVTWTATDVSGNTSTCSFNITVKDMVAPTFTTFPAVVAPATPYMAQSTMISDVVTVGCSKNITVAISATEVYDNCTPFASMTYSWTKSFPAGTIPQVQNGSGVTATGNFPIGVTTITFSAKDADGNVGTHVVTVDIKDGTPPTLLVGITSATLNASTTCTTVPVPDYTSQFSATDNCPSNLEITQVPAAGSTVNAAMSPFDVVVTIKDKNSAAMPAPALTQTIVVTVVNSTTPIPVVANLPAINTSCNQVLAPAAYPGNCTTGSLIYGTPSSVGVTLVPGSSPPAYNFNPGNYNITWSYGSVSQQQTIVVAADATPPVAICKTSLAPITLTTAMPVAVTPSLLDNGSYDPQGCISPLTYTIFPTSVTCSNSPVLLTLTVRDASNNASTCNANVTVIDGVFPTFTPSSFAPVTVDRCNLPMLPTITAADNCSGALTPVLAPVISTQTPTGISAYNYTITRTWTASDAAGNTSTITQVVTVEDVAAPVWTAPTAPYIINTAPNRQTCGDTLRIDLKALAADCAPDADLVFRKTSGGNPATIGLVIPAGNFKEEVALGSGTMSFTATDPSNRVSLPLVINYQVNDATPPVATCLPSINVNITATGTQTILPAQINASSLDNCTPTTSLVYAISQNTFTCANVGAPVLVTLTVRDAAGNASFCTSFVNVQETSAPVINTCPANVTLACTASTAPSATVGQLLSSNVSENCGLAPISFTDVVTPSMLAGTCKVITRTWKATDNAGNSATCNQSITITDANAPVFVLSNFANPNNFATQTVKCISEINLLTPITATDNCSTPVISPVTTVTTPGTCFGKYIVNRTWSAKDECNNTTTYTQTITVNDDVKPSTSAVPATVAVNSQTASSVGCNIQVTQLDMSTVITDCNAVTGTINVYQGTNPSPVRTFASLNGNATYIPGVYKVEYIATDNCGNIAKDTIVLTVVDNTVPTAVCINSVTVALGSNGVGSILATDIGLNSNDNCGIASMALAPSSFNCSNLGANTALLTVTDFGGNTNTCAVNITVTAGLVNSFSATVSNGTTSYFGASNGSLTAMPVGGSGNFTYLWSNNATTATVTGLISGTYTVTVTDATTNCKMVLSGTVNQGPKLAINIGTVAGASGSMIEIPVTVQQFNNIRSMQFRLNVTNAAVATVVGITSINPGLNAAGFNSTVSGNSILIAYLDNATTGVTLPNGAVLFNVKVNLIGAVNTASPITLDAIPPGMVEINQSLGGIDVTIPVDINNGAAQINSGQPTSNVGGDIVFWKSPQEPVANVTVNLTGTTTATTTTPATGIYTFSTTTGNNTTVGASKLSPGNDGSMDVGDGLAIVNHIFGTNPFASPYQWVAADVNFSGTVTLADYLKIQKVVLGILPRIDGIGASDWRFIPQSYVFANPPITPTTPIPYPQTISHNPLLTNFVNDDFYAIRFGDVNGTSPVSVVNNNNSDRFYSDKTLNFRVDEQSFKAGELLTVKVKASEFEKRQAYQMTMAFDTKVMQLEDIQMGALPNLTEENFGTTHLDQGYLTTFWVNKDKVTLSEDETVFTLTFRTLKASEHLSEVLSIGSQITASKAIDADGNSQDVTFEYILPVGNGVVEAQQFMLYQNQPNPFDGTTRVAFRLPNQTDATFKVYNTAGQIVKILSQNFEKGYNEIRMDASELGAAGVYYYEIETPTHRERKKMVIFN
jgi:hypothetical protein